MNAEEIYSELSAHFIKGMMAHDQFSDMYDFLSLRGYKRFHEYQFKKDSCAYKKIHRFYINHYNRLIIEKEVSDPALIPASWYRYIRQEVDASTKKSAVKTAIEKWIDWEKDTKTKLTTAYKGLIDADDVCGAEMVKELLYDVSHELKMAERKKLDLEAMDYSLAYIIGEQTHIHDKYKRKMKW